MRVRTAVHFPDQENFSSLPPVLLFVFAAGLLTLMCVVVEPFLILPTAAFLLMVGVTHHLGQKLYLDLAGTADRALPAGARQ